MMSCYSSWNCLTTMAMFASFMGAVMVDLTQPECFNQMGTVTIMMIIGLLVNSVIGCVLAALTVYLVYTRAPTSFSRFYLGRCQVETVGSRNKCVFTLVYIQDVIAFFLFILMISFVGKANEHCPAGYTAFYKMTIFLQSFVMIRIFLFCVHFTRRGPTFYKWLRR